jgi:branched-chain amino acid transport system substrate-binding protein
MRRPHRAGLVPLTAASAVTALALAACSSTAASTTSSTSSAKPITVGISLPLTGSFAADGQATENGYKLWASDVNTNGGLLGRPVRLVIRNDNSNEKTVASDYNVLINQDHVDLTLAPFSTLLTNDALPVTAKYGYALPAGSATGNLVFGAGGRTYSNLFSVSVPVAVAMKPFSNWVVTLPPNDRRTAAYPMVDDPFADPPVQTTQATLQAHGVQTKYSHIGGPGQIQAEANRVASLKPDIVVIGSVDLPSLLIFVHTFQNAGYTPKVMIAASGPDQGQAFLNKLNPVNAAGIMVPDAWSGATSNALSHVMVENYIAKFGGTSSDINADVAEAYSAGEVLADAVTATKGTDNKKIISYLHNKLPKAGLQTVQGPVRFTAIGKNAAQTGFIYQWQNGGSFNQVLPAADQGSSPIVATKPQWGQGG